MLLRLMLLDYLIYFSMMLMSDNEAIWLVVTMMPLLSEQRKLAVTLDLMDLRGLLILKIYSSAHVIMILELSWLMGMMICFLEGPLVVIFSFRCHKLHLAISPSILHRFSWSQWLRKALEKTFRSVPVTSRGDQ